MVSLSILFRVDGCHVISIFHRRVKILSVNKRYCCCHLMLGKGYKK